MNTQDCKLFPLFCKFREIDWQICLSYRHSWLGTIRQTDGILNTDTTERATSNTSYVSRHYLGDFPDLNLHELCNSQRNIHLVLRGETLGGCQIVQKLGHKTKFGPFLYQLILAAWLQRSSDRPQMEKIQYNFWSDFSTFRLDEPNCTKIRSVKIPDLSHLVQIWPNWRSIMISL